MHWHALSSPTPLGTRLARGARVAGRRGEPVAARLSDAPARTRRCGPPRRRRRSSRCVALRLPPTRIGVHVRRHARLGRRRARAPGGGGGGARPPPAGGGGPPRACSSLPPPPPPRPVSCTFPSASLRRHRAAHHPTDPLISRGPVRSTHPTNRANTRALTAAPNAGSSARLGGRAPVLHHAARELGHSSERGSCGFEPLVGRYTQACISAASI
jgi:hypothetical protein